MLLAATVAAGTLLLERHTEHVVLDGLESSLRNECLLLSPYVETCFTAMDPDSALANLANLGRQTGIRLTLIRPDGSVLADSATEASQMENHAGRPEVRDAVSGDFGRARRYSGTVKMPMLYMARAVQRDGVTLGVLRAAIPLERVDAAIGGMRRALLSGAALGILLALALAGWMARRITAPILEMTEAARKLREGAYDQPVRGLPHDEIGVLGDALNRLAEELTSRIAHFSNARAQLEAMIAGMVEGVFAVDEEEQVLFCNRAACDLFGVDNLQQSNRKIWETVSVSGLLELLSRTRVEKKPAHAELVVSHGAEEVILDAHAVCFEGGETRGIVVVLHDISDLRRLERMRRDFVANVSHELKSPLTAIRGYVETLLSGALHDEVNNVRFLQKMDAQVHRLSKLVADLLSLARIESQEGCLALEPVDGSTLLEQSLKRHEEALRNKGLTWALDAADGPVRLLGNAEAMGQVLDNLLDNAIQYTPSPGRISLRASKIGRCGCVEVQDTGIGIPEKELGRIFERFYRVDRARSKELGGTGLGLSIVKHLVQSMHGEVRVESQEGKGSRFTVSLPLAFL